MKFVWRPKVDTDLPTTPTNSGLSIKLNPLHLNISMHILHTVLYKFPMTKTR